MYLLEIAVTGKAKGKGKIDLKNPWLQKKARKAERANGSIHTTYLNNLGQAGHSSPAPPLQTPCVLLQHHCLTPTAAC